MTITMVSIMVLLLIIGFPMMMPLIVATLVAVVFFMSGIGLDVIIQQMIGGIKGSSLIAIPMFILAADIITRGHSADRLVDLVLRCVGHLKGGLAVSVTSACALFGAVCGSTQATVVAVGSAMRPKMLKAGYKDSFTIALIVNAADLAYLIPPSIGMIIYGVISGTSISKLFLAGIGPGILIVIMFSLYCIWYARKNNLPVLKKSSWLERLKSLKKAVWPLGFPLIVVGGIYGGIFSPTEAAAVCVLYAIILEVLVFRSVSPRLISDIALSTGLVTSMVFILIAAGSGFSWVLSFAQIPQQIISSLGLDEASPLMILIAINIAFFIGCMFVDSVVVILILVPIFAPLVSAAGIDPVLVGVIITMQVAIGAATPPFGCNIFTAMAVFRRPFVDVVKGLHPFLIMLLFATALVMIFPSIALFLPEMAF